MSTVMKKCEGSGGSQVVDWPPDDEGYPGASVCIHCSYGVMLLKGSITKGVSVAGHEGQFGKLRVHYVNRDLSKMSYRKSGK